VENNSRERDKMLPSNLRYIAHLLYRSECNDIHCRLLVSVWFFQFFFQADARQFKSGLFGRTW